MNCWGFYVKSFVYIVFFVFFIVLKGSFVEIYCIDENFKVKRLYSLFKVIRFVFVRFGVCDFVVVRV